MAEPEKKPTPQEIAQKIADKAKAEKAKASAPEKEEDELVKAVNTPDEPLSPEAQAAADAIINSDIDANTEETQLPSPPSRLDRELLNSRYIPTQEQAKAAYEKIRQVAVAYQAETPDTHIVFGHGKVRITLGDLRDLFQLPR